MSNKKSKEISNKVGLELIPLTVKIPLEITEEVYDKIRYLCSRIDKVEWSGILFYSVEGTISSYDNLKLKTEDIHLMDKGTPGYTEYETDESVVKYMMENPHAMDWKIGLIHSHNNMQTFFSGTDLSELNDNSEYHSYYLSLIVNNYMSMTAKVAFRGNSNGFYCKDEKGNPWVLNLKEDRESLFTMDCIITKPIGEPKVDSKFEQRTDFIIKEAAQKHKVRTIVPAVPTKASESAFYSDRTIDEEFAIFVLRLGSDDVEKDTIENALEDISQAIEGSDKEDKLTEEDFASSLIYQYVKLYEKFWDDFGLCDEKSFIGNTENLLLELSSWENMYPVCTLICEYLRATLKKMETNEQR